MGVWGLCVGRAVTSPLPPTGQYPTQPSYPVQSAANPPVYPQTVPLPQPPPYTDAPPAYSEVSTVSFLLEQ